MYGWNRRRDVKPNTESQMMVARYSPCPSSNVTPNFYSVKKDILKGASAVSVVFLDRG